MSDSTKKLLKYYSGSLGFSESDIIEALCLLYLSNSNEDITHCNKCGKPIAWEAILPAMGCEVECKCGTSTFVGEKIEFPSGKSLKEYFNEE